MQIETLYSFLVFCPTTETQFRDKMYFARPKADTTLLSKSYDSRGKKSLTQIKYDLQLMNVRVFITNTIRGNILIHKVQYSQMFIIFFNF